MLKAGSWRGSSHCSRCSFRPPARRVAIVWPLATVLRSAHVGLLNCTYQPCIAHVAALIASARLFGRGRIFGANLHAASVHQAVLQAAPASTAIFKCPHDEVTFGEASPA